MTDSSPGTIRFLHTNDLHGQLDEPRVAAISELRRGVDYFFDSGDCIRAGNLAIPIRPEEAWGRLAAAGCDLGTLGNRESHVLKSGFEAKVAGRQHQIVCANLRDRTGAPVFPAHLRMMHAQTSIGVFGLMVPMVTARMLSVPASAFLWEDPIEVGCRMVNELRSEVDVLVAITHIGYRQDVRLAEQAGAIDIIFGGHSHTVLEAPESVGGTWICQGGSHGKYVGNYEFNLAKRELTGGLITLVRG